MGGKGRVIFFPPSSTVSLPVHVSYGSALTRSSLHSPLPLLYSSVSLSLLSPSRLRLRSPPAEGLGRLYRRVQLLHAAVRLGRRLHVRQLAIGQGEQRTCE